MTLYIGLMSGTSMDGVDATLVSFDAAEAATLRIGGHVHRPLAAELKAELLALNSEQGRNELHRAALAANALSLTYAEAVDDLLRTTGTSASEVRAIGAHGQTVRHRPREFDGVGYTLQLNAPALLAEHTGIDVVADFRSRDLAAGGVGAPLVPAFHRAVFGRPGMTISVLNLGGIGNLTVLHGDGTTRGFDCGPGNALMDHWSELHHGSPFDAEGAWAASGQVVDALLDALLLEPFFSAPPPKSTGRDLFNAEWLMAKLKPFQRRALRPRDVQATLAELTARSCAAEFQRHASEARELVVCGGGALNAELMRRIAVRLPEVQVVASDYLGLPAMQVEACAFAWLAQAFVEGRACDLASVTGARGPRLLGALYPGG